MKVKIATHALEFCGYQLKLKAFEDCGGTVNFINIMNDVLKYSITTLFIHLVERNPCALKTWLYKSTIWNTIDYLTSLKLLIGELLVGLQQKTGFIALIINMKSVELYFSAIRARGGFNNNLNLTWSYSIWSSIQNISNESWDQRRRNR